MNGYGMLLRIIVLISFTIFFINCSSPTESKFNPPSDHTVSKNGVKHKNGLSSPIANCISCHGSDLRGGESGVSCYECHGKKW